MMENAEPSDNWYEDSSEDEAIHFEPGFVLPPTDKIIEAGNGIINHTSFILESDAGKETCQHKWTSPGKLRILIQYLNDLKRASLEMRDFVACHNRWKKLCSVPTAEEQTTWQMIGEGLEAVNDTLQLMAESDPFQSSWIHRVQSNEQPTYEIPTYVSGRICAFEMLTLLQGLNACTKVVTAGRTDPIVSEILLRVFDCDDLNNTAAVLSYYPWLPIWTPDIYRLKIDGGLEGLRSLILYLKEKKSKPFPDFDEMLAVGRIVALNRSRARQIASDQSEATTKEPQPKEESTDTNINLTWSTLYNQASLFKVGAKYQEAERTILVLLDTYEAGAIPKNEVPEHSLDEAAQLLVEVASKNGSWNTVDRLCGEATTFSLQKQVLYLSVLLKYDPEDDEENVKQRNKYLRRLLDLGRGTPTSQAPKYKDMTELQANTRNINSKAELSSESQIKEYLPASIGETMGEYKNSETDPTETQTTRSNLGLEIGITGDRPTVATENIGKPTERSENSQVNAHGRLTENIDLDPGGQSESSVLHRREDQQGESTTTGGPVNTRLENVDSLDSYSTTMETTSPEVSEEIITYLRAIGTPLRILRS